MQRLPQLLVERDRGRPAEIVAAPEVLAELDAVESELGERGRVLVRASGTEPVVRVMVEATDEAEAQPPPSGCARWSNGCWRGPEHMIRPGQRGRGHRSRLGPTTP